MKSKLFGKITRVILIGLLSAGLYGCKKSEQPPANEPVALEQPVMKPTEATMPEEKMAPAHDEKMMFQEDGYEQPLPEDDGLEDGDMNDEMLPSEEDTLYPSDEMMEDPMDALPPIEECANPDDCPEDEPLEVQ
ncbi:MAG: hypothetical protein HQM12_07615 [SAR324 cluster bacterium]|nr:hypothetical protein [SAR324 cluster bacterium]